MSKEAYISYIVELIRNECFTTANSAFNFHLTDPKRPKPTKGITQFKQYWKIAQERYKEAQNLLYNWVPVMNANKEHLGFVQLIGATGEVEWKRTIIS